MFRKRILAAIVSAAMCLSLTPAWVYADVDTAVAETEITAEEEPYEVTDESVPEEDTEIVQEVSVPEEDTEIVQETESEIDIDEDVTDENMLAIDHLTAGEIGYDVGYYHGPSGVGYLMEVFGSGSTWSFADIERREFNQYRSYIDVIVIGGNIERLGVNVFADLPNLKTVYINAETLYWIDNGAFQNCPNLEEVIVNTNSLIRIGDYAFDGCTSLKQFTWENDSVKDGYIPYINTGAFRNCTNLQEINLPSTLMEIRANAFENCSSLKKVVIPDSVTSIAADAFLGCSNANFRLSGSPNSLAETYCYNNNINYEMYTTGICGPDLTYELSGIQYDTNGLIKGLTLKISGSGAMYNYGMSDRPPWYKYRETLTSVKMPAGLTTVGDWAFADCYRVRTSIPDSVTSIGNYAFRNCTMLSELNLQKTITVLKSHVFEGCENLKVYVADKLTEIEAYAFKGAKNITVKSISDSVTIDSAAFADAENVTLYGTAGSSVERFCYGRDNCTFSVNITGSYGDSFSYTITGNRTDGYALSLNGSGEMPDFSPEDLPPWFDYSDNITSISMSYYITGIGAYAFGGCTRLTEFETTRYVENISEYAFTGCSNLKTVNIISADTAIESNAFFLCDQLTIIGIPGSRAESYASNNNISFAVDYTNLCGDLTYNIKGTHAAGYVLTIRGNGEIPDYNSAALTPWFDSLSHIQTITINNGCSRIGKNSFALLVYAANITIPDSVTSIGENAFAYCTSLKKLYVPASVTEIAENAFTGTDVTLVVELNSPAYRFAKAYDIKYEVKKAAVTITTQPANVSVAAGKTASFSVATSRTDVSYQWQYSTNNGVSWTNSSALSAKTATLTTTAQTAYSGRLYRCIVKDSSGKSVTSNSAKLTVTSTTSLAITSQPSSITASAGTKVTFKVVATGTGLTYQWQYSTNNGSSWISSTATSAKTAELSTTVQSTFNGRLYRCIVKDSSGKTLTSSSAKLTVK